MRVSVVDAVAELQSLDKAKWIRNCSHLADHFTIRIFEKYGDSKEICLIFDRYDLPSSLKEGTRIKRQGGQNPVYYRITASTHIAKGIECAERSGRRVVICIAWSSQYKGTNTSKQPRRYRHEDNITCS